MKGITIPCPYCKEILLRHALISGGGSFETLCPHCKELVTVVMGQEPWITAHQKKIMVVLFVFTGMTALYAIGTANRINNTITSLLNDYQIEIIK